MESEEAKKNFLLKIGVVFVIALIIVFWFLNTKDIFKFNDQADLEAKEGPQLEEFHQEFSKAIDKLREEVEKLQTNEELRHIIETELLEEIGGEIKKNTSSSTDPGTLVSPGTVLPEIPAIEIPLKTTPTNCPAYVNCMPTIGTAPVCQIPPGCEGITQLVY